MTCTKYFIFSGCSSMTEKEARKSSKMISLKNDWGKPCKFPFKYNGEEHVSCTKKDRFDNGGSIIDKGVAWCATEVDINGEVLKSGACKSTCDNCKTSFKTFLTHKFTLLNSQ